MVVANSMNRPYYRLSVNIGGVSSLKREYLCFLLASYDSFISLCSGEDARISCSIGKYSFRWRNSSSVVRLVMAASLDYIIFTAESLSVFNAPRPVAVI